MATAYVAVPAKANQDSSGFPSVVVESYTIGGVKTIYAGGSIPVGAVIDFRVWVDLYNVDPVRIGYGDGASDSYSFEGSFTHEFYHAYQEAGVYAPVAYMPTDSGTFDGSVSQPVTIGGSSWGSTGPPSSTGTPSSTWTPSGTGASTSGQITSGFLGFFSSVGGLFGASGTDAVTVGIVASVVAVSVIGIVGARIAVSVGKARAITSKKKKPQAPPSYIRQIPPTYSQPSQPERPQTTEAGSPITGDAGQLLSGDGAHVEPGLPSINLRSKWTRENPGSGSLKAVRRVDLEWDPIEYDQSAYKLEGYEIWKMFGQEPVARLLPGSTSWSGVFQGDVQGVTVRAVFSTVQWWDSGGTRYVYATSYVPWGL